MPYPHRLKRKAPVRPHQHRARHREDRVRSIQLEPCRVRSGKRGRDSSRGNRVAGGDQEARAQDRCCQALPVGLGDEQRLTQVLLNLVGNAIKFTDSGEVRISAAAKNGHFSVAVTDTGPGIPPAELKRVFEQFHQVDNSNTKAKGGTGLGLAIAKQIVEMHGGRIWVESTPGKGATFQMELPTRAESQRA